MREILLIRSVFKSM